MQGTEREELKNAYSESHKVGVIISKVLGAIKGELHRRVSVHHFNIKGFPVKA
jgi:hypothetical protein